MPSKCLHVAADIDRLAAGFRMGAHQRMDAGGLHVAGVLDLHLAHLPGVAFLARQAVGRLEVVADADGAQLAGDGLHARRTGSRRRGTGW